MMKANATFAGRNHALGLVVGLVGGLTLGLAATAEAREVYQGRLLPESGGAARKVSIIVDTFTSSAEAARLQEVLRTKGPLALERAIGKRPVFAAGNSDGDLAMLQWTSAGTGPRFGLIVHHTDAAREWAYDRDSAVGRLDKALDSAAAAGWTVVDMKADWAKVWTGE